MTSITHFHFTFQLHTSTTHFHFILQLYISTSNLHYNSHFKQCLLTAVIYIHIPLPEVIVPLIASRSAEWPLPEPSSNGSSSDVYMHSILSNDFYYTLSFHTSTSLFHFKPPFHTPSLNCTSSHNAVIPTDLYVSP